MKKFDIYIAVPIWPDIDLKDNQELLIFKKRGWAGLDLSFKMAKELLAKLKQYRSGGYIALSAYRIPKITLSEARDIATKEYDQIVTKGKRLNMLGEGWDNVTCWTFHADDIDALEKDLIPGRISISIDKIDGHVRAEEEYKSWIKQSII